MIKPKPQGSRPGEILFQRLHILWLIVFLLFVVLILRLAWVQLGGGEKYQKLAEENNFKQIPILAPRGKIYSAEGELLVGNESLFTAMYLETEGDKKEKLQTAKNLAEALDMSVKKVLEKMDVGLDPKGNSVPRKQPAYYPKKIKDRLTEEEVVQLSEHPSQYKGVNIFLEPLRDYREDTFAVQTIGYVRPFAGAKASLQKYKQADNKPEDGGYLDWEQVGMDGIEYSYQDYLRGQHGYKVVRVNSTGKPVEVIKEVKPRPGNHLTLTLDESMQLETEAFIEKQLQWLREEAPGRHRAPNARNAYAVAMEVKTGKIRTMVSYPDYDPNIWNGPVTAEDYKRLTYTIRNGTIQEAPYDARNAAHPEEEYRRHPMSVVPLGSTFKPLMALMALQERLIGPQTIFQDPGTYYYATATPPVRNSSNHNYGALNVYKAIQKSANTFFAWTANRWYRRDGKESLDQFRRYTHQFGLGVPTEVPLKGEQDGSEGYLSESFSPLGAMVLSSFGQAQRYTTMQLAQFTATLAHDGKRMKPLLVEKVKNQDGETVKEFQPKVLNQSSIEYRHFQTVKEAMAQVTQPGGTASNLFQDLPFDVAAKTGTSEQDVPGQGRVENSVFIAFAPAKDPEIAVAVVVPEGGYGSIAAGPIAEKMISVYAEDYMKNSG
ncbi:MAG: penicillin-binding transpeptidase domain-containing protein [Firmicutes bacterium]|uniref:Penicillin-binding protein 2 n=1 Tax=Melghirimyces thermohalophilus TaxID=1236220 RepID=A0A1G6QFT3_9BACL|nr:penicillin-binding transpeptidase domain-containing protein [Melghirimyces thermohalophilus]MDA8351872.1 penicillin-binding transpeptidase domain-containing protein [Bacillota bacterium]SDC90515.1 penicillin-binding protein 2 [Melghirimyces thermohalophilus]